MDDEIKLGDEIYLPTRLFIGRAIEDFSGGLCEVIEVIERRSGHNKIKMVRVKENPDKLYNWTQYLQPIQEQLKAKYGEQRGTQTPITDLSFNESISLVDYILKAQDRLRRRDPEHPSLDLIQVEDNFILLNPGFSDIYDSVESYVRDLSEIVDNLD